MSDYTVQTVDLSTAHDPGVLVGGEDPPGRRVLIPEVPDTAYIRIGQDPEAGDPIPLLGGFQDCIEDGERVYVKNPEGSGTLRVVFTDDPDLDPGDVSPPTTDGFAPTRLGGDLAADSPFDGGDVAGETVSVTGVDQLDVRAMVEGIADFAQASKSTIYPDASSYGGVAVARDGSERAFVLDQSDGQMHEVDLSEEAAPTLAATLNLTGFSSGTDHIVFDPDENVVLALGDDGGVNPTLTLAVIDVSTPGTPVEDASFAVDTDSGIYSMQRVPGEAQVLVFRGELELIDYSTSTNPSSLDTVNADVGTVGIYIESQATAYGFSLGDVTIVDVKPSLGALVVIGGPTDITAEADFTSVQSGTMAFADQGANLGFVSAENSDNIGGFAMYKLEPSGLTFIDEEYSTGFQAPVDGEIDESSRRLLAVNANSGGIPVHLWSYDETEFRKLDTFNPDRQERTVAFGLDFTLIHVPQSDQHEVWEFDEGADVLRVAPLDPAGDPIAGLVQKDNLRDAEEGLVSMDLDGIGKVLVQHRAATGRSGTRRYFDVYREAL